MSLIDDLRVDLGKYATDFCKTEIVDFRIAPADGKNLNVGETFYFKVKVTNNGNLDMKNVRVRVQGSSYVDVAKLSGSFSDHKYADPRDCPSGKDFITGEFRGRTKQATSVVKDIVTARIYYDPVFTGRGADEGKLRKVILPSD